MKKMKLTMVLAVVVAMASAFATVSTGDQEYYLDGNTMKELTPNGGCFPSDAFCKYTHIPGTPNDGDPEHYEGVPETEGLIWIPQP